MLSQVPGFQTVSYPIVKSVSRGGEVVETNTLGLLRPVTREDFSSQNSSLNIKCVASIYTAYYKTVEQVTSLKMRKKLKRRRGDLRKKQQQNQPKTDNNNGITELKVVYLKSFKHSLFSGDAIQLVSVSDSSNPVIGYFVKVLSIIICLNVFTF